MTTRRHRRLGAVLAAVAISLLGCASSFDPPQAYVRLRNPGVFDVKAVSPTGNVVALRSFCNEGDGGDLKYWSDALEHEKTGADGMKLIGREAIRSKAGRDGTLFRFELGEGQNRVAYLIALYAGAERITTVEAAGPPDSIAADFDQLRAAAQSVR